MGSARARRWHTLANPKITAGSAAKERCRHLHSTREQRPHGSWEAGARFLVKVEGFNDSGHETLVRTTGKIVRRVGFLAHLQTLNPHFPPNADIQPLSLALSAFEKTSDRAQRPQFARNRPSLWGRFLKPTPPLHRRSRRPAHARRGRAYRASLPERRDPACRSFDRLRTSSKRRPCCPPRG